MRAGAFDWYKGLNARVQSRLDGPLTAKNEERLYASNVRQNSVRHTLPIHVKDVADNIAQ